MLGSKLYRFRALILTKYGIEGLKVNVLVDRMNLPELACFRDNDALVSVNVPFSCF